MQKYKELATKLFENRNKNFAIFSQTATTLQLVEDLSPQSYYATYVALYQGSKFFAFLSQVATAVSSYTFFAALVAVKISSSFLPFVVCFVLLLIEVLKYLTLRTALKSFFALPPSRNYVLLGFAFVLSALSMYASLHGAANFAIATTPIESVTAKYESAILAVKNEIQGITQRNSWQGKVYLPKKERELLYQKEAQLTALATEKQTALRQLHDTQAQQATQFQFGFAFFDLLFILCSLYGFHFSRCVVLEEKAHQLAASLPPAVPSSAVTNDVIGQAPTPPPSSQGKPIGFTFANLNRKVAKTNPKEATAPVRELTPVVTPNVGTGNKVCAYCQKLYTYKIHNQKYCRTACRVAAWEAKTQQVLPFKAKKGATRYQQQSLF